MSVNMLQKDTATCIQIDLTDVIATIVHLMPSIRDQVNDRAAPFQYSSTLNAMTIIQDILDINIHNCTDADYRRGSLEYLLTDNYDMITRTVMSKLYPAIGRLNEYELSLLSFTLTEFSVMISLPAVEWAQAISRQA